VLRGMCSGIGGLVSATSGKETKESWGLRDGELSEAPAEESEMICDQ
jgi:hypothetical protein